MASLAKAKEYDREELDKYMYNAYVRTDMGELDNNGIPIRINELNIMEGEKFREIQQKERTLKWTMDLIREIKDKKSKGRTSPQFGKNEGLKFQNVPENIEEINKKLMSIYYNVKRKRNDMINENLKNPNFTGKIIRKKKIARYTRKRTKKGVKDLPDISEGGRRRRKKKTRKKQFLYNPNDPSKSFDVYIDKNPNDTIPIKYTTLKDVKDTIKKLEKLFKGKKYSHKRIWQVGMIMKVRLEAMNKYKKTRYKKAKNVYSRYQLSKRYFKFLGDRTKKKSFNDRKKMVFKFNSKTRKKNE